MAMNRMIIDASQVRAVVRHAICSVLEIQDDMLSDDDDFERDLSIDSLIFLEALTIIEEELELRIPDEDAKHVRSVTSAVATIEKTYAGAEIGQHEPIVADD